MTNLKGFTRRIQIPGARVLVTGPNDAGKTSILETVAIGILGQVPRLGKRGTMALASGPAMTAGLTVEQDGRELAIDREFRATEDGGWTESIRIAPSRGERSKRDGEDRIKKTIGDCATMIDLSGFHALTPGKRMEFLARLIG